MPNAWDQQNRLVKALLGTHESDYFYDGDSRRVRIKELESGTQTKDETFVWCGSRICQKRSGATVERNYFEQGFEEGTSGYFYARDHLGSVREVVGSDGTTVASRVSYDPWGKSTGSGSGALSDFGFTGHYFDRPTRLGLTKYRGYDPGLGRWLSRDPIGLRGGSNLYGYVLGDPLRFRDRYGLDGENPDAQMLCTERHRRRNANNTCPKKESECDRPNWAYDSSDKKYRGVAGDECAYDGNGDLLPDERGRYTYNYSPYPYTGFWGFFAHLLLDVYPHFSCDGYDGYDPGLTTSY